MMARFPTNRQKVPIPFAAATLDEALESSGLSPEITTLFRRLLYPKNNWLLFAAMVETFPKADNVTRKKMYDFYLANTRYVNSWDLVDLSARDLVGAYLFDRSRKPLYRLAKSEPMVPLQADGAAVLLPGAGRGNATLILTLYLGLAVLLALGMWGTHVPQHRL